MRRALLIFLMMLVPFQAAWSAGHALHGHLDATTAHNHSHDSDHEQEHGGGVDFMADASAIHDDDGHHGSHVHAAYTFMVADAGIGLTNPRTGQPPPAPPASFTSHIPPLYDPPPVVRI
jgi:hypothetical protein